jgi:acylphosphatase
VTGRVANRSDGSVFIDVQGDSAAVESFLRDISGPRGLSDARIVQRVAEAPISPDLVAFEISRE